MGTTKLEVLLSIQLVLDSNWYYASTRFIVIALRIKLSILTLICDFTSVPLRSYHVTFLPLSPFGVGEEVHSSLGS